MIVNPHSPDILIKGRGTAGLLAALALSRAGFNVVMDAPNPVPLPRISPPAFISITPVTVKIFQALGIWEAIQKAGVSSFEQIKVWTDNFEHAVLFDGQKAGQFPLGYIIDTQVIKQALLNALDKIISSLIRPYGAPSPARGEGEKVAALLTIAADGAASATRKAAGIPCDIKHYGQHALTALIHTEIPHEKIARQRFLPSGPLGFLPLSDPHHCAIVWSHGSDTAKALSVMPEADFNCALQAAFGAVLGEIRLTSERSIFPLKMQHARQYVAPRLALIGDAAHTVHPLAGYGANMGFLDAMALTRILKKASFEKRDIGGLHTLRKYERERQSENSLMLNVIDSFTKPLLRQLGLSLTEKSAYLKKFFIQWMSHHGEENAVI